MSCLLELTPDGNELQATSDQISAEREKKYPPGLLCPGSFFKNVPVDQLSREARRRIPKDFILFGKVAAGELLESVGANGSSRGDARIADYHGNLFFNDGKASFREMLQLAEQYRKLVRKKFRVDLEPEILSVGERPLSNCNPRGPILEGE